MTRQFLQGAVVAVFAASAGWSAQAQLVHRYSFTSDATDSIGTAHGAVVNPSGAAATFSGGQLHLSANNDFSSNQDFANPGAQGAYVNLPNGIVSSLGNRATFEMWVTVETNRNWAELYSFGKSDGAEDSASGAGGSRYVALIPQNGQNGLLRYTHRGVPANSENWVDAAAALSTGVSHHVVTTWDETDFTAGTAGTGYLYLDGARIGSVALRDDIRLASLTDVNNWLGRSQWPDPLFDGSFDEFRIYNVPLSASDVALSFARGPNAVPEPSALALASLAGCGLMARRRRRK